MVENRAMPGFQLWSKQDYEIYIGFKNRNVADI